MPESPSNARGRGRASRISISLPDELLDDLRSLSQRQARSMSNLCALILRSGVDAMKDES